MRKLVRYVILVAALAPLGAFAATYYSIASGNWSNPAIWSTSSNGTSCGCTPKGSDNVYITHSIVLDKHLTNGNGALGGISGTYYIYSTGKLLGGNTYNVNVLANGSLTVCGQLTVVNIEFYNGSWFRFCAGSSVTVNGTFINRNNSPNITIDGVVYITQSFENGNGAIITGSGQFIITYGLAINNGSLFGCVSQYPCGQYPCAINSYCGTSTALPVDFTEVSAIPSSHGAVIKWSTATEINSDHFEVEKSTDGTEFDIIGQVPAAGHSTQLLYYQYQDINTFTQESIFYRIKEVDKDGRLTYSPIQMYGATQGTNLKIYPNPVEGNKLSGSMIGMSGKEWQIELNDPEGRLIKSYHGIGEEGNGNNLNFFLPEGMSAGYYLLRFTSGNFTQTQKLLVRP